MNTVYSVQSFSHIKGGVRPDIPVPASCEESAMRLAERQASAAAGAVVLRTVVDFSGVIISTDVLEVYGALPDYIIERLTI